MLLIKIEKNINEYEIKINDEKIGYAGKKLYGCYGSYNGISYKYNNINDAIFDIIKKHINENNIEFHSDYGIGK